MIVVSHVWKEFGFGTIIYLAAITTIDPGFYLAISLSKSYLAAAGRVSFLPVGFTLASYEAVIDRRDYWQATLVSVRLGLGVSVNMILTVLAAYPLSKEPDSSGDGRSTCGSCSSPCCSPVD